jgi:hypothetical protein
VGTTIVTSTPAEVRPSEPSEDGKMASTLLVKRRSDAVGTSQTRSAQWEWRTRWVVNPRQMLASCVSVRPSGIPWPGAYTTVDSTYTRMTIPMALQINGLPYSR